MLQSSCIQETRHNNANCLYMKRICITICNNLITSIDIRLYLKSENIFAVKDNYQNLVHSQKKKKLK